MHLWGKEDLYYKPTCYQISLSPTANAGWRAEIYASYGNTKTITKSYRFLWKILYLDVDQGYFCFVRLAIFDQLTSAHIIQDTIASLIPDHMQSGNILQTSSCLGNASVWSSSHLCAKMAAFSTQLTEKFTKLKLSKIKISCAVAVHSNE